VSFECPSPESVYPCVCQLESQKLLCTDIDKKFSIEIVTQNAAKNISQLKFKFVEITNTSITEIRQNDLSSIAIGDKLLTISGNRYLTKISPKALRNVNTETLAFNDNALENDAPNQFDIFQVKFGSYNLRLLLF